MTLGDGETWAWAALIAGLLLFCVFAAKCVAFLIKG